MTQRVVFSATTNNQGEELWITDGTTAGTVQLKDINPGSTSSHPSDFFPLGNDLVFLASDGTPTQFWITDGTAAGTHVLAGVDPTTSSVPVPISSIADKLFFNVPAGESSVTGLWVTDGTAGGTARLLSGSSSPMYFAQLGSKLVFSAGGGAGAELWASDGTAAGTGLVKDLTPGGFSSNPGGFSPLGNRLVFYTVPDFSSSDPGGLWITDGTSAGTVLVKQANPDFFFITTSDSAQVGNRLYFEAFGGAGTELWATDGTAAGTSLVKDIVPGAGSSSPQDLTALNGKLIFTAFASGTGQELWISDGTADGTTLLKDIRPGTDQSFLTGFTALGNKLLFIADSDGDLAKELWITDGTNAGTELLKNITPVLDGSGKLGAAIGNKLIFSANDGTGQDLWITDGTAAGTVLLKDINPFGSFPNGFTVIDDGAVNAAPSVGLTNKLASILENTSTVSHIKVADIVVTDDGVGTNVLSLTGADAIQFEIVGTQLFLKAGVTLDFETKTSYQISVQVDDAAVGGTPDASTSYTLAVTDVSEPANAAPSAVTLANAATSIAENTSTATRVLVADISVTDDGAGANALSLTGTDAIQFEIVGNQLFLKAGVALDFETKSSYSVAVQANDPTVGSDPDATSATYMLAVGNVSPEILTGTSAANTLVGGIDSDIISGLGGNDTLNGGAGNDALAGGTGRDVMAGGADHDVFDFNTISEIGKTSAARDRITDFAHGTDHIDLQTIDASTKSAGNQKFKFIGTSGFHHKAGELHYLKQNLAGSSHDKTIVEGDVNGDGHADFQIELTGLKTLSAGDFVL